jgi:tetratricopeptide (TPR) repeat protein
MRIKREPLAAVGEPLFTRECEQAIERLEKGDTSVARRLSARLLKQNPDDPMGNYLSGLFLAFENTPTLAIPFFERVVRGLPDFAAAHYNLGLAFRLDARIPDAVRQYRTVIQLDGARGEIGEKAQEEIDMLESALAKTEGLGLDAFLEIHDAFDRAVGCLCEGKLEESSRLFFQVLTVKPGHAPSYGNLGLVYGASGRKQKALEYFDKALALDLAYEPAIENRKRVSLLKEGVKLEVEQIHVIAYGYNGKP